MIRPSDCWVGIMRLWPPDGRRVRPSDHHANYELYILGVFYEL